MVAQTNNFVLSVRIISFQLILLSVLNVRHQPAQILAESLLAFTISSMPTMHAHPVHRQPQTNAPFVPGIPSIHRIIIAENVKASSMLLALVLVQATFLRLKTQQLLVYFARRIQYNNNALYASTSSTILTLVHVLNARVRTPVHAVVVPVLIITSMGNKFVVSALMQQLKKHVPLA